MANLDLSTISIEELQKAIQKREKPEPMFEKNGVKYYSVEQYNALLSYYDRYGIPKDFSPMEFEKNGVAKVADPQEVAINLDAFLTNRVRKVGKEFHLVIDTRTIREQPTGEVTLAVIPEYVLKQNAKFTTTGGFEITRSAVTREDFLKHYNESFGIEDMLNVLRYIDLNAEKLAEVAGTLSLAD